MSSLYAESVCTYLMGVSNCILLFYILSEFLTTFNVFQELWISCTAVVLLITVHSCESEHWIFHENPLTAFLNLGFQD